MRVVIFGATGHLGRHVVDRALSAGHEVTAVVRRDGAMEPRVGLRIVTSDLTDQAGVSAAAAGHDVAISTLGPAFRMGSRAPVDFMQRHLAPLHAAIAGAGVPRFVLVSAFGVGQTAQKASPLARGVYRLLTAPLFEDKARAEAALPASPPVTCIVYPVNLKESPSSAAAAVRSIESVGRVPGLPTLPFVDAAAAIVRVATADDFGPDRLLVTTPRGWRPA